ncbi:MAG: TonB-dependent receptor [Gammaproteobacteria bacterium]|nr:TonB-dependent receptor [Gammaproteobacteria bacterium]MDH3409207.1 TonB-dependent receptor [Gammaproteobacteria bacterium]MDH3551035.1 TonB-dependent receptor [Gammaproteobacteria bacterium]
MTINTFRANQFLHGAVLAVVLTFGPGAALYAQDTDNDEVIEEIVSIGTPGGGGVERQQASFALTTIDPEAIAKFSPKSTADLFKSVPGVWAESSGGVAGANIDVRGLPGGSDAPFVTLAINGSPIYGTEMLSFFEQSSIFRVDETIAGVEALRGGPNAVFGKGEPGVTVNFNLKEGSEDTEGRIKYTTSDYGLQRLDGVLSGELTENLYYMVGGYVSSSDGIRDPQFSAEEGSQFTINLNRVFDDGEINLFARVTDDVGQWILPFALDTGNDKGEFAQLGNATRFREIPINPAGDTKVFDFANGRGWDGLVAGGSAEFEFGDGWTFRDQFTYTSGDANTFGFVPSGSPVSVSDLEAVIGGPVTTESGSTLSGSDWAQTYGHWVVLKDLEAKINDISINKQFENHDLTFGYYAARWSADDWWTLGNPIPVQNIKNGEPLDSSITPADIAAAGGDAGFLFGLQSSGDASAEAFYIADSWYINDRWRIDAGVRRESFETDYVDDEGSGFPDGTNDVITDLSDNETAWTVAANFDVNDDLGVYARYSDGFLFPHFDDIRGGSETVNAVEQLEAGVKFTSDWLELYATAFHNTNDDFSSTVGSTVPAAAFETESTGVEADGTLIFGEFTINFLLTVQNAEITKSTTVEDEGNAVRRQPDFQARISPSYNFTVGEFDGSVYAAYTTVDDRWGDDANTVKLPSYNKFDLGVLLYHDAGFFFQLHGDNVNDSDGITEGDPRDPTAPNGRPIFGTSWRLSVGYDFGD